ncbi:MAG: radical SAM protein [Elusimicrobia bacterium]|nr:radical SAM protein [Elusimicrobiota bacterium]
MTRPRAMALSFIRIFKPLFGATIMFSVTNRCQCACARCAVQGGENAAGPELAGEEIKKLIAEAARLGAREVSFFGGEPLLREDLPDMIRFTRGLGLRATLTTNGLLLDGAAAAKLAEAGLNRAGISLDDPSPEVHDRERGVPGLWENAAAAARQLIKLGVPVDISFCATKDRLWDGRAAKMAEIAARFGARLRILSPMRAGRWDSKADKVLTAEDRKILRALLTPGKVHWVLGQVDSPDAPFVCSSFDRWKVDITATGDVVPCTYFPAPFGNIRKESLLKIVKRMWASPLYREFKGTEDCPLNDPAFRSHWADLFKSL